MQACQMIRSIPSLRMYKQIYSTCHVLQSDIRLRPVPGCDDLHVSKFALNACTNDKTMSLRNPSVSYCLKLFLICTICNEQLGGYSLLMSSAMRTFSNCASLGMASQTHTPGITINVDTSARASYLFSTFRDAPVIEACFTLRCTPALLM